MLLLLFELVLLNGLAVLDALDALLGEYTFGSSVIVPLLRVGKRFITCPFDDATRNCCRRERLAIEPPGELDVSCRSAYTTFARSSVPQSSKLSPGRSCGSTPCC